MNPLRRRNVGEAAHDMSASQRVIRRRTELGWSQTELAKRAGLHQSTVSEIESGAWPRDPTKARLAQALGVDPHDVWPLSEAPPRRLRTSEPDEVVFD